MNKRLKQCPVCNETLSVVEYYCEKCDLTIRGKFGHGDLGSLTNSQQEFVKIFLCAQGNIKEVEKRLKISYPTVKSKLAKITSQICSDNKKSAEQENYTMILTKIENGEMSVNEALQKLSK